MHISVLEKSVPLLLVDTPPSSMIFTFVFSVPLCASSPVKDNGATSEQNFKLTGSDDDVSMSSKVSVTSSQVTGPTSFRGQGGYGRRLEYRYPSSSSSQTGSSSTTHRKRSSAVKRNPSRLYRVVKPLAEIQAAPSPATKRCIGPEFVVMQQEKEPQVRIC